MLTARQQDLDALIKELTSFRALDKKQLILRIEATPAQIETLNYQRLHNLTTVQNRAKHPATFSFQGERLVLILLSDPAVLERFAIADLRALLTGQPAELRSRLGKTSTLYVYAELGVAFASRRNDSSKIQYVEVFQPQSIESYKSTIYQDPEALLPQ